MTQEPFIIAGIPFGVHKTEGFLTIVTRTGLTGEDAEAQRKMMQLITERLDNKLFTHKGFARGRLNLTARIAEKVADNLKHINDILGGLQSEFRTLDDYLRKYDPEYAQRELVARRELQPFAEAAAKLAAAKNGSPPTEEEFLTAFVQVRTQRQSL